MIKQKRNELCQCKSGKKYKQCCFIKHENLKKQEEDKYINGHPDSSEEIKPCANYLRDEYKDHKIIDISNYLSDSTYKIFQIKNYKSKIIMIAQKNDFNKDVFTSRSQLFNDVIIMYRGSYRTLVLDEFNKYMNSIDVMIQTRLLDKEDK